MFLVRRAKDVMDTDIVFAQAESGFNTFLNQPEHGGRLRHVVVVDGQRIIGVLRVNTALRNAAQEALAGVSLRELASRDFTFVRDNDINFDVIQRMWRKRAIMALVMTGKGVPRASNVVGCITKEHVADSVASSVKIYPS
jgi:CIC family chloride channel protein